MKRNRLLNRRRLIFCDVLYLFLFNYVYIAIVTKRWAYAGFTFEWPPLQSILVASVLGLLPMVWMPNRITRPSQVLYWILYAIVYIPSLYLPHYLNRQSSSDLYLLNLAFFVSFYILGLVYRVPLRKISGPKLSKRAWWAFIAVTGGILYLAVMAVYGGRLQLAGLYNIELRLASRSLDTAFFTGYGQIWLANVINPMLMALGLFRKKPLLFLLGAAGQILLFMTVAAKAWLLSIVLLPLIFLVLNTRKGKIGLRFMIGTSGLLLGTIILKIYNSPFSSSVQDLIGFRLFSDPGFATAVYSDFFSKNLWTHWSHLKGISALVKYPYDLSINYLIGNYLGSIQNSANAHAWATDGIAAMGITGVLVVGLLMGTIFYIFDCAAIGIDPRLSGLSIAMHGIALSNLSLVSSCFGGGIFFNMILFWLMPRHAGSPGYKPDRKLPREITAIKEDRALL